MPYIRNILYIFTVELKLMTYENRDQKKDHQS